MGSKRERCRLCRSLFRSLCHVCWLRAVPSAEDSLCCAGGVEVQVLHSGSTGVPIAVLAAPSREGPVEGGDIAFLRSAHERPHLVQCTAAA